MTTLSQTENLPLTRSLDEARAARGKTDRRMWLVMLIALALAMALDVFAHRHDTQAPTDDLSFTLAD